MVRVIMGLKRRQKPLTVLFTLLLDRDAAKRRGSAIPVEQIRIMIYNKAFVFYLQIIDIPGKKRNMHIREA